MPDTITPPALRLGDFIDAYEEAQAQDGHADLADHLPEADHPLYRDVLGELVRVDLEYAWQRGQPRRLEEYLERYPQLVCDRDALQAIAFEEFRLREQAGEKPAAEEYQQRFGIRLPDGPAAVGGATIRGAPDLGELEAAARAYQEFLQQHAESDGPGIDSWCSAYRGSVQHAQVFREVHAADPEAAGRLAEAVTTMPAVGDSFLDFELVGELGRGAFGRVFLARQSALAERLVALKISTDLQGESHTLAQLQHTNIVPIYSIHRSEPFQAVCMPYFGGTTLADICQDLASRESLPDSGKVLVGTLSVRRSLTRTGPPSAVNRPSPQPQDNGQRTTDNGQRTTDRDVILQKLAGMTYVQAILWIGARLADGLAHAHERGILHRDLKPANVLLTDEGQPMLLDFNLSEDVKQRGGAAGASVGGTLFYMAPEHLDAFQGGSGVVDARSDLYSLGLILYELLTRRAPCPDKKGSLRALLLRLVEVRKEPPPDARQWNPTLSPAVASILRHCLEPDPARRYQSAGELRDDLERQLNDLPLRHAPELSLRERAGKWVRRHPRLTSSTTVGAVAAWLLLVLGSAFGTWALNTAQREEARQSLEEFREELRTAQFLLHTQSNDRGKRDQGVRACRAGLERYQVLEKPGWQRQTRVRHLPLADQERLREDIGELLLLLARATAQDATDLPPGADRDEELRQARDFNQRAEACYAADESPPTLWSQRAELARLLGQKAEAEALAEKAKALPPRTPRDQYLIAAEYASQGHYRQASPLLQAAARQDPKNFWACFIEGICHDRLAQDAEAVACYSMCIALWPDYAWSYFNRGSVRLRQRDAAQAKADFDRALALRPDLIEAYINRALAWDGLGKPQEAIQDLTRALDLGAPDTRIWFLRARIRERAGDKEWAQRDRAEGLRRVPVDEHSWNARGFAREVSDPQSALADFRKALELNPRSFGALQNIARVLCDDPKHLTEAVDCLTRALEVAPDYVPARSGRGVLLARLGKRTEALADAREALVRDPRPDIVYQVAGIYALTSRQNPDDRLKAYHFLAAALRQGFGFDLLESDEDLEPLHKEPEFRRLLAAAQALRAGAVLPR